MKTILKFLSKTRKEANGCLIWTGRFDKNGYGRVTYMQKAWWAHRMSWFLHNGDIPKGMCILHICDTPSCVNPVHLKIGTRRDNNHDCISKGRNARGSNSVKAKITEKDVLSIRAIWEAGNTPQTAIGEKFNLSQSQISQIVRRQKWAHVPERENK